MKKVICIDSKNFGNPLFTGPSHKEGDTLTVTWEGDHDGIYSYEFAETGYYYRYSAWRYAVLPDATADEMQEEEFIHEPFSC